VQARLEIIPGLQIDATGDTVILAEVEARPPKSEIILAVEAIIFISLPMYRTACAD
jgi:hypothetical protein